MRSSCIAMVFMASMSAVQAREVSVEVHSARPFGYFVGDLIHARIDIHADPGWTLQTASLPHPGPLTVSFNLREIDAREEPEGNAKVWRLYATYQTFYVALDAREIEIPAFSVTFSSADGPQAVAIPSWRIGVSPLREIQPQARDNPLDYMRPDSSGSYVDERPAGTLTIAFGVLTLLGAFAVARDRAWPPFRTRRARNFTALARRISADAKRPYSAETYRSALQSLHRGVDAAAGRSILAEDLPAFLDSRREFDPLRASFQRFFAASRAVFFGPPQNPAHSDFGMAELADFARRLSAQERAGP